MKEAALLALASDAFKGGKAIIFFSTKQAAHRARLQFGLAELPPVAELHGNLTQAQRLEALESFREVRVPVGLAADSMHVSVCLPGIQCGLARHQSHAKLACW